MTQKKNKILSTQKRKSNLYTHNTCLCQTQIMESENNDGAKFQRHHQPRAIMPHTSKKDFIFILHHCTGWYYTAAAAKLMHLSFWLCKVYDIYHKQATLPSPEGNLCKFRYQPLLSTCSAEGYW